MNENIYGYLCKHVIGCPWLHIDVKTFVFQPELMYQPERTRIFITDFLHPLMHAVEREKNAIFEFRRSDMRVKFFTIKSMIEIPRLCMNELDVTHCRINRVLESFAKCQRIYYAICQFQNICKHRYAKCKNKQDLHLENISENDKGTYVVLHGSVKYVFRVNELRNIITTCISNTDDFFPDVLNIRNPYNNLPFSLCDLYNFYFFLKTNNYGISTLLHGFFMSNFNVPAYIMDYEIFIRDKAIEDRAMRGTVKSLYPSVFRMLTKYRNCVRNIEISRGFPMKTLVDVMRPYLRLYFYVMHYAQDFPKRFKCEELLEKRLSEFDYICPTFGRRIHHSSLLFINRIPVSEGNESLCKLFSRFGSVHATSVIPLTCSAGKKWASGYVAFTNVISGDAAMNGLQGYCFNDNIKEGLKISKHNRVVSPHIEHINMDGLSAPYIEYNARHPSFYHMKDSGGITKMIETKLIFNQEEDKLFNRISKCGVNGWCENNDDPDDIDDGMYVYEYYRMLSEVSSSFSYTYRSRNYRNSQFQSRIRSPSESVESNSTQDDNSIHDTEYSSSDEYDNMSIESTVSHDTNILEIDENDVEPTISFIIHAINAANNRETQQTPEQVEQADPETALESEQVEQANPEPEHNNEPELEVKPEYIPESVPEPIQDSEIDEEETIHSELCDTISRELAAMSLCEMRTERHLHMAETIYERLNSMTVEHDIAIRQIDDEYNLINEQLHSDTDSDDED